MTNTSQTSTQDFRDELLSMGAITQLDILSHEFLQKLDPDLGSNAQKLLYVFLSLLNDGNTCYALNADMLEKKWKDKWEGLCLLAQIDGTSPNYKSADFHNIIKAGIDEIRQNLNAPTGSRLFERRVSDQQSSNTTRPFVIHDDENGISWCYAAKYFDAKCVIENKIGKLFDHANSDDANISTADEILTHTFLNEEQKEAVRRGIRQNLIITGGPGTGKTTVVTFLLGCLLTVCPDTQNYDIYLAAPSGKAADRMRESIAESIENLPADVPQNVRESIRALESYTIHRLLRFSPGKNAFTMNKENMFSPHSIFVIDEASMIDIGLFASLLQAIPEGARIFILGDPDQLPSVEAGAVLGDLLKADGKFVSKLVESKRFTDNSEIGIFAKKLQTDEAGSGLRFASKLPDGGWGTKKSDEAYLATHKTLDKVNKIQIIDSDKADDRKAMKERLETIVKSWTDRFYREIQTLAAQIDPSLPDDEFESKQKAALDALWKQVSLARILSAERRSLVGVDALNRAVCTHLGHASEAYFEGQLLMLTQNQSSLRLYNGDSGVVLKTKENQFYLLLNKPRMENGTQKNYVKYPLSVLPSDALEAAFAITVHKAQGSGYPHVMVFLPTRKGHPLLTHEIVYTAVTRTKGQSLTIVSNSDCFKDACNRTVTRDTGIVLKSW